VQNAFGNYLNFLLQEERKFLRVLSRLMAGRPLNRACKIRRCMGAFEQFLVMGGCMPELKEE